MQEASYVIRPKGWLYSTNRSDYSRLQPAPQWIHSFDQMVRLLARDPILAFDDGSDGHDRLRRQAMAGHDGLAVLQSCGCRDLR